MLCEFSEAYYYLENGEILTEKKPRYAAIGIHEDSHSDSSFCADNNYGKIASDVAKIAGALIERVMDMTTTHMLDTLEWLTNVDLRRIVGTVEEKNIHSWTVLMYAIRLVLNKDPRSQQEKMVTRSWI